MKNVLLFNGMCTDGRRHVSAPQNVWARTPINIDELEQKYVHAVQTIILHYHVKGCNSCNFQTYFYDSI